MQNIESIILDNLDKAKRLRYGGDSNESLSLLEETLSLAREAGFYQGEIKALGALGLAHKNLGHFEEAIAFLHEAVALSRKLSSWHDLNVSLKNLGSALSELGRTEEALPLYEEARDICARQDDLKGLATSEVFLGNLHLRLEDLDLAEVHYLAAEETILCD